MRIGLTGLLIAIAGLNLTWAQDGESDLFTLISGRDPAVVQAAINAGADVNMRQTTGLEATPLMWATGVGDPAFVEMLIVAGAEVDVRDAMGDPAINWAAYYGNTGAISLLLEAGADTELVGHGTPVQIVMRRGHQHSLAVLVDHLGSVPQRSATEAAIEVAALTGDVATLEMLASDADMSAARDWAGRPVLQAAARGNQPDAIAALIGAGAPVDADDAIGFTALFEAARDGHSEAVAALLAGGADPNHVSHESALALTPTHLAAIGGDVDSVRFLIEADVNLDAVGTMGATPLLWALFEGSREAALLLVEAGTDTSIAGNFGDTARPIAEARGWDDVIAAIDARSAQQD